MNSPFKYVWRTFSIAICKKHLMAFQIIALICLVSVTQPFYLKNYRENHQVTNDWKSCNISSVYSSPTWYYQIKSDTHIIFP